MAVAGYWRMPAAVMVQGFWQLSILAASSGVEFVVVLAAGCWVLRLSVMGAVNIGDGRRLVRLRALGGVCCGVPAASILRLSMAALVGRRRLPVLGSSWIGLCSGGVGCQLLTTTGNCKCTGIVAAGGPLRLQLSATGAADSGESNGVLAAASVAGCCCRLRKLQKAAMAGG